MSGKIGEAQDLVNPVTGNKERVSALYAVAGKKKEKVSEKLLAGDLGCTVKLRNVKTNQTLNQPDHEEVVEPIVFPPSRYRTAIKAKDEKDEEKLGEALNRAAAEDPHNGSGVFQRTQANHPQRPGRAAHQYPKMAPQQHQQTRELISSLRRFPIERQSPRLQMPPIVTENSQVVQVNSVRLLSLSNLS